MTKQISDQVTRYEGSLTAANDEGTTIRFRFPYEGKALKFRDAMIKLGVATQVQPLNPTDMVIHL